MALSDEEMKELEELNRRKNKGMKRPKISEKEIRKKDAAILMNDTIIQHNKAAEIVETKAVIEQAKMNNSADGTEKALDERVQRAAANQIAKEDIPEQQKVDAINKGSSEKAIFRTAKKINETQDSEQAPSTSVVDKFKDALVYFAPQLIGGFISQELSGTGDAGFVAGAEAGGKARDSYINYQQEERQFKADHETKMQKAIDKLKPKSKVDITPDFQHKDSGEALYTEVDPQTGLVNFKTVGSGEIVSAKKAISIKEVGQQQREIGVNQRFKGRLDDKQIDRQEKTLKAFIDKPDVRKGVGARDTMSPIINMLESKMPVTNDFLAPFVARGVQKEVGNLSETDLANARVPLPFYEKIKSNISGFMQGDMNDVERGQLVNLLKFMQEKNDKQLGEKLEGYATQERADRIGISREELIEQMSQESGINYKKKRSRTKGSVQLKKLSPADRAAVEEMKNKMRGQ